MSKVFTKDVWYIQGHNTWKTEVDITDPVAGFHNYLVELVSDYFHIQFVEISFRNAVEKEIRQRRVH